MRRSCRRRRPMPPQGPRRCWRRSSMHRVRKQRAGREASGRAARRAVRGAAGGWGGGGQGRQSSSQSGRQRGKQCVCVCAVGQAERQGRLQALTNVVILHPPYLALASPPLPPGASFPPRGLCLELCTLGWVSFLPFRSLLLRCPSSPLLLASPPYTPEHRAVVPSLSNAMHPHFNLDYPHIHAAFYLSSHHISPH